MEPHPYTLCDSKDIKLVYRDVKIQKRRRKSDDFFKSLASHTHKSQYGPFRNFPLRGKTVYCLWLYSYGIGLDMVIKLTDLVYLPEQNDALLHEAYIEI